MSQFDTKMTELADAIKVKNTSVSGKLSVQGMIDAVSNIEVGVNTSDADVTAADVLHDKVFYGANGRDVGTMPEITISNDGTKIIVPVGYNNTEQTFQIGGGTGDSTAEYGIIDAEGNFQAIDLSGDVPTDTGEAQTMQELIMFNTGHSEPEYSDDGNGGGSDGGTVGSAIKFYECTSYNATDKSWSGYEVTQGDTGAWIKADEITSGLTVGYLIPAVGEIYSADTSILIKKMFDGSIYPIPSDGLIFYAPLATDYANLVNKEQAVIRGGELTTYNGLKCVYLDGSEYIEWADDSNLPTGSDACSLFILVSPQDQSTWRTYISMGQENIDHLNISLGNGVFMEWGGTPLRVDGKWHSLCIARNNQGEANAYIDGTFNASGSRAGILPSPSRMCVGANMESSYVHKVKSYVAYVAAYDRELSAAEVLEIHNTLMEGVQQ